MAPRKFCAGLKAHDNPEKSPHPSAVKKLLFFFFCFCHHPLRLINKRMKSAHIETILAKIGDGMKRRVLRLLLSLWKGVVWKFWIHMGCVVFRACCMDEMSLWGGKRNNNREESGKGYGLLQVEWEKKFAGLLFCNITIIFCKPSYVSCDVWLIVACIYFFVQFRMAEAPLRPLFFFHRFIIHEILVALILFASKHCKFVCS